MREHVTHHGGEQRAMLEPRVVPLLPEKVTCGMRVGFGGAHVYSPYWHLVTCKRCNPKARTA